MCVLRWNSSECTSQHAALDVQKQLCLSPCPPPPRNCWNRINPPPKGINLLLSFLSSRAHIENLDKWTGYKLPTRTTDHTSKLLYLPHAGGGGNHCWDRPWSSPSKSQQGLEACPKHVSQLLMEGLIKWLGLSLKLHPALSPALPLREAQVDPTQGSHSITLQIW